MNELNYKFIRWLPDLWPEPWTLLTDPYFQTTAVHTLLSHCHLKIQTPKNKFVMFTLKQAPFCHPYFYSWYQHSINQASSKPSSHPGLLPAFTLYMKSVSKSSQLLFFETCFFFSHLHCHHPSFSHSILKFILTEFPRRLPILYTHTTARFLLKYDFHFARPLCKSNQFFPWNKAKTF